MSESAYVIGLLLTLLYLILSGFRVSWVELIKAQFN